VDETEKGWHIQYIDRDPQALARQEELKKKHQAEMDHEERNRRFIQAQVKEAHATFRDEYDFDEHEQKEWKSDEKVSISLDVKPKITKLKTDVGLKRTAVDVFGKYEEQATKVLKSVAKRSAMDSIIAEEQRQRIRRDEEDDRSNRKDNWITKDIVVKVMDKNVGDGRFVQCFI
jgi:DNA/RNA-binding protein KIN17